MFAPLCAGRNPDQASDQGGNAGYDGTLSYAPHPDPGIARLTARSASGPLTVPPSAVRSSAVGHFVSGRSRFLVDDAPDSVAEHRLQKERDHEADRDHEEHGG